jgi:hypothetical protein
MDTSSLLNLILILTALQLPLSCLITHYIIKNLKYPVFILIFSLLAVPVSFLLKNYIASHEIISSWKSIPETLQICSSTLCSYMCYLFFHKILKNKTIELIVESGSIILIFICFCSASSGIPENAQWWLYTSLSITMGIWFSHIDKEDGEQNAKAAEKSLEELFKR